jgi:hypothetical protein
MKLFGALIRTVTGDRRNSIAYKTDPNIEERSQIRSSGLNGRGASSSRKGPLSDRAGHSLPSGGLSARKNEDQLSRRRSVSLCHLLWIPVGD